MGESGGQVAVRFLRDFVDTAGTFRCTAGAEYVVDAASASAFMLAGIAIKVAHNLPE